MINTDRLQLQAAYSEAVSSGIYCRAGEFFRMSGVGLLKAEHSLKQWRITGIPLRMHLICDQGEWIILVCDRARNRVPHLFQQAGPRLSIRERGAQYHLIDEISCHPFQPGECPARNRSADDDDRQECISMQ